MFFLLDYLRNGNSEGSKSVSADAVYAYPSEWEIPYFFIRKPFFLQLNLIKRVVS